MLDAGDAGARVGVEDGTVGCIPLTRLAWARPWREGRRLGPPVRRASDVLRVGDVVAVEAVVEDGDGRPYAVATYGLRQVPEVNGALVALDPHTGRVLALSGGYRFRRGRDEFNRAVQAWRQPGSAFKPFVYLAALEKGYTPATIFPDVPVALPLGRGRGLWQPRNYGGTYLGPRPMRVGLERSRNLMTINVARRVGMARIARVAERFGVVESLPRQLAMAIGAGETTLLRLTAAYAMFANGGRRVVPTLVDRVQDRHGRTIYRHDRRPCADCRAAAWRDQPVPAIPEARRRLTDPVSAYQVVSMLRGVVERGTGRRVRAVGRPVAGKTGTTNDSRDAWFVGFTPDLVVGVYVGFDQPQTLGPRETGARAAAPIFTEFMRAALDGRPARPFHIPPGVRLVRVRLSDGRPARPGDGGVIWEAFKPGTEPHEAASRPQAEAEAPSPPPTAGGDAAAPGVPQAPQSPKTPQERRIPQVASVAFSGTGGLY